MIPLASEQSVWHFCFLYTAQHFIWINFGFFLLLLLWFVNLFLFVRFFPRFDYSTCTTRMNCVLLVDGSLGKVKFCIFCLCVGLFVFLRFSLQFNHNIYPCAALQCTHPLCYYNKCGWGWCFFSLQLYVEIENNCVRFFGFSSAYSSSFFCTYLNAHRAHEQCYLYVFPLVSLGPHDSRLFFRCQREKERGSNLNLLNNSPAILWWSYIGKNYLHTQRRHIS